MSTYLKFLSRNKLYTVIEAVGLAVSLAFVIIIGSYAWQQYSITRESPDAKNIYTFGMPKYTGLTYAFTDELVARVPEVERRCVIAMECLRTSNLRKVRRRSRRTSLAPTFSSCSRTCNLSKEVPMASNRSRMSLLARPLRGHTT